MDATPGNDADDGIESLLPAMPVFEATMCAAPAAATSIVFGWDGGLSAIVEDEDNKLLILKEIGDADFDGALLFILKFLEEVLDFDDEDELEDVDEFDNSSPVVVLLKEHVNFSFKFKLLIISLCCVGVDKELCSLDTSLVDDFLLCFSFESSDWTDKDEVLQEDDDDALVCRCLFTLVFGFFLLELFFLGDFVALVSLESSSFFSLMLFSVKLWLFVVLIVFVIFWLNELLSLFNSSLRLFSSFLENVSTLLLFADDELTFGDWFLAEGDE